jgi:hypothetical protein
MRRGVMVGCADEKHREEGAGFGASGRRTAARSQASIGAGQKRLTSVGARPHKPSQIGHPGERSNRGDTRDVGLSRSIGGERSRLSALGRDRKQRLRQRCDVQVDGNRIGRQKATDTLGRRDLSAAPPFTETWGAALFTRRAQDPGRRRWGWDGAV